MGATFSATYDSTVVREDLSDVITIMTPTDLPLTSLLDEESCHDVYFDWAVDELPTPTAVASVAENATLSYAAGAEVVRLKAGCGINTNTVQVADTRRVVTEAGYDDAYNYQLWKQSVATMKQAEFNNHWGYEAAEVTTAVARIPTGVLAWGLQTFWDEPISGVATGTYGSYKPTFQNGSGADMTRDDLHDILQNGYTNGMNIGGSVALCGAKMKRIISAMAMVYANGTSRRNISVASKAWGETIDFFESDFGEIAINLDRYMDGTTSVSWNATGGPTSVVFEDAFIVIEPERFHRMILRGLGHVPIAKDGDSTKGLCVIESGIKCDNMLACTGGWDQAA